MYCVSSINGEGYFSEDMVHFLNCAQSARYIEWGAKLWDLQVNSEHKLIFVFSKEDHARFKERWGNKNDNKVEN
ncbi:MAG: hypothetical protein J6R59_09650 [Paludibacteraceae bacterium]|nr:hypothetical protein [Paludibacteraceae bacterium]